VDELIAALKAEMPSLSLLGPIVKALARIKHPKLADALLGLFVKAPGEQRRALAPLLSTYRAHIEKALAERLDIDRETRIVLSAHVGSPEQQVVDDILQLDPESRVRVLDLIGVQEAVLAKMPWSEWLDDDPGLHAGLAAKAAAELGLRDLIPSLRALLSAHPSPEIVRALGEIRDRESVPLLQPLMDEGRSKLTPLVLESLGRIGGPEARRAIRTAIFQEWCEPRLAYRALSLCATEEDDAIFRKAIGHPDWYVRLACAEVLGRFGRPENLAALSQLAADSVSIVSQRALSSLES
jgi:HEAT repeat protein